MKINFVGTIFLLFISFHGMAESSDRLLIGVNFFSAEMWTPMNEMHDALMKACPMNPYATLECYNKFDKKERKYITYPLYSGPTEKSEKVGDLVGFLRININYDTRLEFEFVNKAGKVFAFVCDEHGEGYCSHTALEQKNEWFNI